jgi:hypothetical protein
VLARQQHPYDASERLLLAATNALTNGGKVYQIRHRRLELKKARLRDKIGPDFSFSAGHGYFKGHLARLLMKTIVFKDKAVALIERMANSIILEHFDQPQTFEGNNRVKQLFALL